MALLANSSLSWASSAEEIETAIGESRIASASIEYPHRATVLDRGGVAWLFRYQQSKEKNQADLAEAARVSRMAVEALLPGDPKEWLIRSHFSGILWEWSKTIDDAETFETAIKDALLAGRDAMELMDRGCLGWWQTQSNVAGILFERAQRDYRIKPLDEAIAFQRKGVGAECLTTNWTCGNLSRLSAMLGERHRRTGSLEDLNEAIEQGHRAVDMAKGLPEADTDAAYMNLSAALFDHFRATGFYRSLVAAMEASGYRLEKYRPGRTIEDFPANHAMNLCQHGKMLEAKCHHLRYTGRATAMAALEEAIVYKRRALKLLSEDDVNTPHVLSSVATSYGTKAIMTQNRVWGQEGVTLLKDFLDPQSDARFRVGDRADLLATVAHLFAVQYQILKGRSPEEAGRMLDEGITKGREATKLSDISDPRLGERRLNLAKMLTSRFNDSNNADTDAYTEAKQNFILAAKTDNAPIPIRIPAAIQGGLFHWREKEFDDAHELLQQAIALLSTENLLAVPKQDLYETVRQASGLASFAASIALEAGRPVFEALRSLEAARCVTSGIAMRENEDLSKLRAVEQVLADKYAGLRTELAQVSHQMQGSSTSLSFQSLRQLQQALLQSLSEKEDKIREVEGFENFQRLLTEVQVKELASDGPIIAINVSQIRSDAFVVSRDGIKKVKLRKLKFGQLQDKLALFDRLGNEARRNAVRREQEEEHARSIRDQAAAALEWLWDAAVQPILEKTQLTETKRVWWITSGQAGRAPLHAAGCHAPGSTDNTVSRVVSSYISSFKAFHHAQGQRAMSVAVASRERARLKKRNMLLVTVAQNPPPHHDLDTAAEEKVIHDIFGPESFSSTAGGPSFLTHLSQPDPAAVLSQLSSHAFVHFACHGASVAYDPSQSGLLLVERYKEQQQQPQDRDGNENNEEGADVANANGQYDVARPGNRRPPEWDKWLPAMLTITNLERAFAEKPLSVADGAGTVAYLSACSTAELADGRLADEAIHLANSLQALGFQHVIGTMWGADDVAAGEVARRFYEELEFVQGRGGANACRDRELENEHEEDGGDGAKPAIEGGGDGGGGSDSDGSVELDVAGALHKAILSYKDESSGRPEMALEWCPFIHIGV
jgi:CHAT domain-containing protein